MACTVAGMRVPLGYLCFQKRPAPHQVSSIRRSSSRTMKTSDNVLVPDISASTEERPKVDNEDVPQVDTMHYFPQPPISITLPSLLLNTNEVERESSISHGLPVDGRRSSQDVEVQSVPSSGEREGKFIPDSLRGQKIWCMPRVLWRHSKKKVKPLGKQSDDHGLGEKREAMMVVTVLIVTLTYQASLNPPGGFWQDDKTEAEARVPAGDKHEVGTAVNRNINGFQWFLIANTVALFASLVIILLLTSAITIRRRRMMWVLMALMWISVFSVAFSFLCGVLIILRKLSDPAVKYLFCFGLGCMVLFAILVLFHAFIGLKEIYRWLKLKLRSHRFDHVSSSLPVK